MTSIDFSDGTYKGEINKKGKKNGKGFYVWHDGSTYEGDFKDDFRHGNGLFNWSNGESYKGDYLEDERTGLGIYRWPDGSFYEGSFLKGKRHGFGVYQSINGGIYEGEWFDDMQHGEGKLTNPNRTLIHGVWRNGKIITKPSMLPETASKPKLEKLELQKSSPISTTTSEVQKDKIISSSFQLTNKVSRSTKDSDNPLTESTTTDLQPTPVIDDEVLIPQSNSNSVASTPLQDVQTSSLPSIKAKDTIQSNATNTNIWTGTVEEAENQFVTDLIDGIDTVSDAKSKIPFTGKMQILDKRGFLIGEVNLVNGQLHGEEVFMDKTGAITEKNLWEKGVRQN